MKFLITTMASGWYKGFAPLFEYTAKKFNPEADVKVFYREDLFPKHHDVATSVLRFLIPNEYFKGYDYVYFADVDFIFLKRKPSLFEYHKHIMDKTGLCYSGYRGRSRRKGKLIWDGNNTRIAGGMFMASKEWFERTKGMREECIGKVKKNIPFREKDEIYLYRICKKAGLKTPKETNCFINGTKFDIGYRFLHLGDFKTDFSYRWMNKARMQEKYLTRKNAKAYIRFVHDDHDYRQLVRHAITSRPIRDIFTNLTYHLGKYSV